MSRAGRFVGEMAKVLIGQPFVVAAQWERIGKLEHELRQGQHDNTVWLFLETERNALRDRAEKAEQERDEARRHNVELSRLRATEQARADAAEQECDQQRDEARTLADEVARLKRACAVRGEAMDEQTARLVLHEEVEREARQCLRIYACRLDSRADALRDALDTLAAAAKEPG